MDIAIRIEAQDVSAELAALRDWLGAEDELRGRVQPEPMFLDVGKLGPVLDTLVVALGSGGAVAASAKALSAVVIQWLQRRTGDVKITLVRADGSSLEYEAKAVSGMTLSEVDAAVDKLSRSLDSTPDAD
ncbi:effector-associated constant component EACC1 [Nocardia heshunensis]